MRQLAPELLVTAKTQRWSPEEVLRAPRRGRDRRTRCLQRASTPQGRTPFPLLKTVQEFDLAASSIPAPTWAYPHQPGVDPGQGERRAYRPGQHGQSHTLIPPGHAAVLADHRFRYLTAADLVETLYRGLADNTVGKTIETLLRNDLVLVDEIGFAPLGNTGPQLLFRFVAAAYERRSRSHSSALRRRSSPPRSRANRSIASPPVSRGHSSTSPGT
ncbi:ATP-binding protein [Ornithinimicrobium panacihumi]|uniref:ATP-binding protein n=1 Tax=Ornithinimicrobium panacihumi TaxID=2008449 RepID=UPI003F88FECB